MGQRKMEIDVEVPPKMDCPGMKPPGQFPVMDRLIANLESAAETIKFNDTARALRMLEHDLVEDCMCEGCREFERLRGTLDGR